MKKIILAVTLLLSLLQADDIVSYDTKDSQEPISKPNHPNTDIH